MNNSQFVFILQITKIVIMQGSSVEQKPSQETLQRMTEQGYHSLLNAIQNHDYDDVFRLHDDVSAKDQLLLKNPLCHVRCRNAYTNRKTVDQKCRAKLQK